MLERGIYDPTTGSFFTRDPLDGVNGTTTVANPYHYVDNDPLNKVDPTGERAQDWEFRDPCWSSGGAQPKGGFGARPYEELESIGYIDFFDLQHQKPFGCVPLPPSRSPGTPFDGVKGPELAVCRSDMAACIMAQYARQIAEGDARDYVTGNRAEDGPGGKGNALQHVTWSALLSLFIGRQQAELYLHTHEAANPDTEHGEYNQMDRANNFYGLRLVAGRPCVCLSLGEALSTGDLAAQAERIASLLRPKVREEVDQGRVCTVGKLSDGGLQLSRGCGQSR